MQVESYANLAEPVLDAMRNFTPLAFDIFTFLLIDKLASSKRQKLKVRKSPAVAVVHLYTPVLDATYLISP